MTTQTKAFCTMLPRPQVVKRMVHSFVNPVTGESLAAKKRAPVVCRVRTI